MGVRAEPTSVALSLHAGDRELLLDSYLPAYDVTERHVAVVDADVRTTYQALWTTSLGHARLVRLLLAARWLPRRAHAAVHRRPPGAGTTTRSVRELLESLGLELLAQRPDDEVVFGGVGRPWRLVADERLHVRGPGVRLAAFTQAGYAKVALSFTVRPFGTGRTLLTVEIRSAGTDPDSRELFRRYWALIAPFSALIWGRVLQAVTAAAEIHKEAEAVSKMLLDRPIVVPSAQPLLVDRYLAAFSSTVMEHAVVDADVRTTWCALLDLSLLDAGSPWLGTLLWLRRLGRGRPTAALSEGVGVDGFQRLASHPEHEVVFGAAGRFRGPAVTWKAVAADRFADWSEPGWSRVVASFSLRPYGRTRTLLTYEVRTAGPAGWRMARLPFVRSAQRAALRHVGRDAADRTGRGH